MSQSFPWFVKRFSKYFSFLSSHWGLVYAKRPTFPGLRHLFAISDVRNVAHVSDDERAEQELSIIEGVGGEEMRGVL